MEGRAGDDGLTDDVTVSQGQILQNDDSQQNMNLRQNPNPNRNRNQNQGQQQALYPPFENMYLNPNRNHFNEPRRQPRYQLNAEQVISSNYLPSYQNQYMRRPPSQPSTNVNVASNSGGVTGISTFPRKRGDEQQHIQSQSYGVTMNHPSNSGIGNSTSEPMRHDMEDFVRNTRMRISPGQGTPGVVADSSNTSQHTTGFPRPSLNHGQSMANRAQSSNTLLNPLARPYCNSGHPASNHAVPSNTLSRPQARPNPGPGEPMASHAKYSYNYSTQPVVLNPNYFSISPERPNINPDHPMANHALPSNTLSILQARPNSNLGHPMANPTLASNIPSFPLAGRGFVPRVGSYMSPMQIPVTPTAQASVPPAGFTSQPFSVNQPIPAALPSFHHQRPCTQAAIRRNCGCPECTRAITSLGASQIRSRGVSIHQVVPATSSVPPSSHLQEEFVIIPHHSASQTRSQGVSVHQGVPDTPSVPASRAITSLGASQIRNQAVSMHQVVPATSSVPSSSDLQEEFVVVPCHSASQIISQGVSLATPSVPASSVSVPSHTASTSQIRNRGAPVPVRPGYSLPRGTSQQVWVPVRESNLRINEQIRAYMRARYPEADERRLDILVERAVEVIIRRRQVDRHAHMRLDTDHMSHEELVELEERMGYVNTGVGEEIVNEHMIQRTFSALSEKGSETCCICLEEYVEGDQIGSLDCGHKFHSECIKQWLAQKNICPICKKRGIGPRELA